MIKTQQFLLIIISLLVLLPTVSKADMSYTFIKMDCYPDKKFAKISVLYDLNESGQIRTQKHEKDVYYLNETSGKQIICDLGNNQTIALAPRNGVLPKADAVYISLNYMQIPRPFSLADDKWDMSIESKGNGHYRIKYCPSSTDSYRMKNYQIDQDGPVKCEILEMVYQNTIDSHLE